jgi:hypothetical protein
LLLARLSAPLKLERVLVFGIIPSHGAAPLFQYQGAERLLTRHALPLSFAASFLAGRRACQLNYTLANLGHHSTRKLSGSKLSRGPESDL